MNAERPRAASLDLKALLPVSPDAYPQAVDLVRGLVLVIRMDAGAYGAASFLDDRILGPTTQGVWLPLPAVMEAAGQAARLRPIHFIFHAGHVGSTLLSRLLDATGVVLGLREPLPLRTLADAHDALGSIESLLDRAQFDSLLGMLLGLWSRGYDWAQSVTLKATSSAGRLAPRLLEAAPAARAAYLNLRAEPYLATLLGGARSATDLRGHGPGRMRRLLAGRALPTPPLHALSTGELAALGWLVESLACAEALRVPGARVIALDFDRFLQDVAGGTTRVLAHFGLAHDRDALAAILQSGVLQQYSKAPDLPYPPGERTARLAESRRDNRAEIASGLAWLDRMARADGSVAAIVGAGAA